MAATRTHTTGSRVALAGDGGLLTAAAFAVALGLAVLLGTGDHASNVVGGIGLAAALCLGPLIAWRLHGRRVNGSATGGALLGYLAGGAVVFLMMTLTALLAWVGEAVDLPAPGDDTWRLPGLIVGGGIAVIYLAVIAGSDVNALGDLSAKRRAHVPLDIARLVATAAYVVYLVAVATWASGASDVGVVDFILLLAGPGAVGAAVVTVADLMARHDEQRAHGRLIST